MIKTMSFAAVHFSVAFTVAYMMTGSVLIGGAMALVEPAINTVAYYIHEQIWARKNNGSSSAVVVHSHNLAVMSG